MMIPRLFHLILIWGGIGFGGAYSPTAEAGFTTQQLVISDGLEWEERNAEAVALLPDIKNDQPHSPHVFPKQERMQENKGMSGNSPRVQDSSGAVGGALFPHTAFLGVAAEEWVRQGREVVRPIHTPFHIFRPPRFVNTT